MPGTIDDRNRKTHEMTETAQKILDMTVPYLGPASRVFLERQTKYHMNGVNFGEVGKQHIPELSRWVKISAGLLIGKARAAELSQKISLLQ